MIEWRKNPEMSEFMMSYIPGHSEAEIRVAFFDKYGITLTKAQIKGFKTLHHIPSGTVGGQFQKGHPTHNKGKKMSSEQYAKCAPTMFKKGNMPINHKPVGSERITEDGYVMLKIAEPNRWRLKQRVIWEKHFGEKLTNNEVLVFIDGDKTNCEVDNLCKLTRSELARLNQDQLKGNDPEINKVAISIAKIKALMHKKQGDKNI